MPADTGRFGRRDVRGKRSCAHCFCRRAGRAVSAGSDFNREVVRQFGIEYRPDEAYTGWHGMARRSVFVLDRSGVVRYVWVTDDPLIVPNVHDALLALNEL